MRLISTTLIAPRRLSYLQNVRSLPYPKLTPPLKLAKRSIPVLACRWVATGDVHLPVVCLWRAVANDTEESAPSEGSIEASLERSRCA